jgi:hypothetical protein
MVELLPGAVVPTLQSNVGKAANRFAIAFSLRRLNARRSRPAGS